jgi:two-component system C4-dicarboxylate transport sensor histidine kinase DctB
MQQYSILEANHHLPTLIEKVECGEMIELTQQGKAVAVLLSEREYQRLRHHQPSPWEALQTFRQAVNIEQLDIDTDIFSVNRALERDNQLLRAQQEEYKRLEYLSFMATAVAHNLNNPLQAIRGASDYLLDFFNEVTPEEIHNNLHRITTNTERLAKIVKTFRDYARGDRQQREQLNLNDLVKNTTDLFQAQFKHHKIQLQVDLSPQLPYTDSNSFSLQEILMILLSNAREAVTGRERATIWVSTWTTDNQVGFQVADNGPGIAIEQQPRLFMPFHSQKPKGLGLGLYLTKNLLDPLGGNIRYDHRTDSGACFRVSLPITRGE